MKLDAGLRCHIIKHRAKMRRAIRRARWGTVIADVLPLARSVSLAWSAPPDIEKRFNWRG